MSMEQRPLGRTGADVSVIGLGTWQLGGDWGDVDDDAAADVLDAALDAGVTLLDTADVYGDGRSEERIRKALAPRSDRPFVATKAGPPGRPVRGRPVHAREPAGAGSTGRAATSASTPSTSCSCTARRRRSTPTSGSTTPSMSWSPRRRSPRYGVSVETVAEGMTALQHPGVQSIQVILNVFRRKPLEELLPGRRAGRRRHPRPGAARQRSAHRQVRRVDDVPGRRPPELQPARGGLRRRRDVRGRAVRRRRRRCPRGRRDRRTTSRPRPSPCAG